METLSPVGQIGPKKHSLFWWVFLTFVVTTVVMGGGGYYFWQSSRSGADQSSSLKIQTEDKTVLKEAGVAKFADAAEFKDWLAKAGAASDNFGAGMMRSGMMAESASVPMMAAPSVGGLGMDSGADFGLKAGEASVGDPGRYSETNVQVAGIDEPDIVKTDGKEIYYSPERRYYRGGMMPRPVPMKELDLELAPPAPGVTADRADLPAKTSSSIAPIKEPPLPVPPPPAGVRAIKAWPPADLKIESTIDKYGQLLLSGQTLLVQADDGLYGYDVADPAKPAEKWKLSLENDHQIMTARLYQDKVYLVARAGINEVTPCPIVPMKFGRNEISIPCGGVYHPLRPTPADATYSVMKVDAASGQVEQSASFVGSWNSSAVYMSKKYLYVTNTYDGDVIAFIVGFLRVNSELAPGDIVGRLEKLQGYDISNNAKMVELRVILDKWLTALSRDEQLKLQNDLANRMEAYYGEHLRELQKTAVVRVGLDGLTVAGTGEIPGHLLNQFSLDEYQGFLRLATTVGGRGTPLSWEFGVGTDNSVNDVYTLDQNMNQAGSVKNLGNGERIYAVRFLQDKGYVVTFKETDPLYVIDLADARDPQVKGELKIPGYSSYLHPITKDKILGIGKEGNQVKLALFDVSDPANPAERSKYTLEEYWTDVMNTHHAFLLDSTHDVFFMPGGQGGYILSYADDELKLARAVSGLQAKRAVYLGDYLYILGEDKIVVLNEKDWTEVNKLEVPGGDDYPIIY